MTDTAKPIPPADMEKNSRLPAFLGGQVKRLRIEAGLSGNDLAGRARALGLDWTRSSVAGLENGGRDVSVEEVVLLLAAGKWRVADVLPEGSVVSIGRARCRTTHVADFLADRMTPEQFASALDTPESAAELIARDARGEAERHAATTLSALVGQPVTAEHVARIALELWSTSLTEERDRRVRERLEREPAGTQARGYRGRITRDVIDELEQAIADIRSRLDGTTTREHR